MAKGMVTNGGGTIWNHNQASPGLIFSLLSPRWEHQEQEQEEQEARRSRRSKKKQDVDGHEEADISDVVLVQLIIQNTVWPL
jgi:hypothetical protein